MPDVVVDAGVMIGFLNTDDAHHEESVTALAGLVDRGLGVAMSTLTLSEVLVGPARAGAVRLASADARVRDVIGGRFVKLDRNAARDIAIIRATHPRLSAPDAAVVAAANAVGADRILTTDNDFRSVPRAVQLSDFVAEIS